MYFVCTLFRDQESRMKTDRAIRRSDAVVKSRNPAVRCCLAGRIESALAHRCRCADDDWGHTSPWRVRCRFQKRSGFVTLDQIRSVDQERLVKRLGEVGTGSLAEVLQLMQEMFAE